MLIQPLEASHLVRAVSFHFRVPTSVVVLSSSAIRPKTGTWEDETAIFFSAVYWRENQLCSFPVCFSSCKRGSPQTPPLTTRVSNMAACQFLFRIQIFSLCFLCLRLFSLYTTSASSIRGVSLTSKYFLLYLNVYRGDLRCKSGS